MLAESRAPRVLTGHGQGVDDAVLVAGAQFAAEMKRLERKLQNTKQTLGHLRIVAGHFRLEAIDDDGVVVGLVVDHHAGHRLDRHLVDEQNLGGGALGLVLPNRNKLAQLLHVALQG